MTDKPTARGPIFAPSGSDDLSSHSHRLLIGVLGFALAPSLWLLSAIRHVSGLPRWTPLASLSAYYHTGAVAAFVGVLVSLAMFLFTYRGYGNRHNPGDRICAVASGIAALCVAFFPSDAPAGVPNPLWWQPWLATVHYVSAGVLFCAFFVFSFFLFPKTRHGEKPDAPKRARNLLYRACGVGILACMGWIAVNSIVLDRAIFWPETFALSFFSLSWLVKGRADWTVRAAGRKAIHFGLRPGELLKKA